MMSSSAAAEQRVPPLPQDLQDDGGGGGGGGGKTEVTVDGLYAQLDQKEKDLTMCAELGNVLLEKNEELRRQNEALEKEFAENVEVRQMQSDKEINLRRPKKCFRQGRHALNKRPHFEFEIQMYDCDGCNKANRPIAIAGSSTFAAKDMSNPVA